MQYIEYTHVDGQVLTTNDAGKDVIISMAEEPNKDGNKEGEGDAAMLSFVTGLGTLATAIAILNF